MAENITNSMFLKDKNNLNCGVFAVSASAQDIGIYGKTPDPTSQGTPIFHGNRFSSRYLAFADENSKD